MQPELLEAAGKVKTKTSVLIWEQQFGNFWASLVGIFNIFISLHSSGISQLSEAFLANGDTIFLCSVYSSGISPTTWSFLNACSYERQWDVRTERWHLKSERIRNLNACCRRPVPQHPFSCHHPIHYICWTDRRLIQIESDIVMSSSTESMMYVHVCARWVEGHFRRARYSALLLRHHTHAHTPAVRQN